MEQLIKALFALAGALIKKYGMDVVVYTTDKLASRFRKTFAAKNILILGPKGSGKTSLIYLIRHGAPYQKGKDGEITTADPTTMGIIIGHKFSPRDGEWLRIANDLPGDEALRYQWREATEEVKPNGIIFMLDGRNENEIGQAYELLESCYSKGTGQLMAFHVFLNFADRWAGTVTLRREKVREVERQLDTFVCNNPALALLRFDVHSTQLSPHDEAWRDAERALEKFGVDLER